MKKRLGFVSNSSTCSFLIVGWRGNPTKETIRKICEAEGVKLPEAFVLEDHWTGVLENLGWDIECDIAEPIYGVYLLYITDGDYLEEIEDFTDIIEMMQNFAVKADLPSPGFYGGMRGC